MALSDHGQYSGVVDIARNGIDEVIQLQTQAKQDEALIRQLVDALGVATTPLAKDRQEVLRAISAGRARLEGDVGALSMKSPSGQPTPRSKKPKCGNGSLKKGTRRDKD